MSKRTRVTAWVLGWFLLGAGFTLVVEYTPTEWAASPAAYHTPTIEAIVQTSVLVRTEAGSGSGTLIRKGDECYVLTAGHVVQDCTGPVTVVVPLLHRDMIVDEAVYKTELLAYSHPEDGDDIAVLRVLWGDLGKLATPFVMASNLPVGVPLMHCGSFLGDGGINSFSVGNLAFKGRALYGHVFDQMTTPAYPGSSGGGVYTLDGRYAGMLVRGADSTFSLFVPARRLQSWAAANGFAWLLDPDAPAPVDLKAIHPFGEPATQPAEYGHSYQ